MSEPLPVKVECYAGYRADQYPTVFEVWGRRLRVNEILDQWQGTDHRYFKLQAEDNAIYILRHDTMNDCWELTLFSKV